MLSALLAAFATIYAKFLFKEMTTRGFIAINFLVMSLLLLPFSPLFFELSITALSISLIALIVLLDTAANYFYFRSIEIAEVSHVAPIHSIAPIFTLLLSAILISYSVNMEVIIITLVITFSIYVLNLERIGYLSPFIMMLQKKNYYALFAALFFGISAIPAKFALDIYSVINPPTLYMIRNFIISLVFFVAFREEHLIKDIKKLAMIATRGCIVISQWLLFLYAISLGNVTLVVSIAGIAPLFVLVGGYLFLREKITLQKLVAIFGIVFAIVYVISFL